MKRKSRGQTLVEFALVFPLIMLFLFATIDFGYWVFGWSQIQYSARRGAEQASKLQPRLVKSATDYQADSYYNTDPCLQAIVSSARNNGAFTEATSINYKNVFVSFYNNAADKNPALDAKASEIGNVAQVLVSRELTPLTPITSTFVSSFKFSAVSRRTIVSKNPGYKVIGPNGENYTTCVK